MGSRPPSWSPRKGNESEEIDVDEHGRILVRFHWVRPDKDDQEEAAVVPAAGCPGVVRQEMGRPVYSTHWNGGRRRIPGGDPDRPLVVGTVYNKDYKLPYDLPANKTQSGLKSDSTKSHNGYNEIMFEDKKGSEKIGVLAQKDLGVVILNNETRSVG